MQQKLRRLNSAYRKAPPSAGALITIDNIARDTPRSQLAMLAREEEETVVEFSPDKVLANVASENRER
jgi:hypothetical protein